MGIKVLQVTSGLHRNGTETFIMNVLRNLDREKIIFDFLLYEHTDTGYEEEARELGANLYYYAPRRKGLRAYRQSLKEFFENHAAEYQAIHLNAGSFSDTYPLKLAKEHGIPVRISHSHSSSTSGLHNRILHKWHRKNIHRIATDFLACSDVAREWGYRGSSVYDKSTVIPNGIKMADFAYNDQWRKEIRKQLGISENTFTLCHTGAFRPVKNHPFIIDIFAEVKRRNPDSRLILCGAGGLENDIKALVKDRGLENSVIFAGIREDVNKILSASDAYIFPSLYEGLPFALIEAQASGIPVIASDNISPEIKLTERIEQLSLSSATNDWVETILGKKGGKRTGAESEGLQKYDIANTCRLLTDIYTSAKRDKR